MAAASRGHCHARTLYGLPGCNWLWQNCGPRVTTADVFGWRCHNSRREIGRDVLAIRMRSSSEPSTQEVLAGLVERVTFHNGENGFCVLRAPLTTLRGGPYFCITRLRRFGAAAS